jgi:UDP-glucose 4-epimerase
MLEGRARVPFPKIEANMKILVTGGAGFIGSHVADSYLALGHEVVVLDNLSGGGKNTPKKAGFAQLDLRDGQGVLDLFKKERFHVVNNHAAQMSVPDSVKDPRFDASVNVLGLLNLLEAARETGVKKFIHVSSGGTVYGAPKKLPATESYPILPMSPYGITKAVGEDYLRFYKDEHKLDYTVLRYSNVYGPRQLPHGEAGVVAIFIKKLMKGELPTIFGNGKIIRDYVFVGDVARANVAALKKGSGEAYNIGTNKPTDVLQLFNAIAKEMGFKGKPHFGPPRPGDLKANYLSYAKATRELKWKPLTDLKAGIKATADFFRQQA